MAPKCGSGVVIQPKPLRLQVSIQPQTYRHLYWDPTWGQP